MEELYARMGTRHGALSRPLPVDEAADRRGPHFRDTIGASSFDMSRGVSAWSSGGDMPIVRRFVLFDTRDRDPATTPDASRVTFRLDRPIDSVARVCLHAARVPIRLDSYNPGLTADDYVMLSIGLPADDVVAPLSLGSLAGVSAAAPFSRALAYVQLRPMYTGSVFAGVEPDTPPYRYMVDFEAPLQSVDRVTLSWHRYQKWAPTAADPHSTDYVIHNSASGTGDVGTVGDNAFVSLIFYCKARRPQ